MSLIEKALATESFRLEIGTFFYGYKILSMETIPEGIYVSYENTHDFDDNKEETLLGEVEFFDIMEDIYLCNILNWSPHYDSGVNDGVTWCVTIGYADGTKKEWSGIGAYPEEWERFREILCHVGLPIII